MVELDFHPSKVDKMSTTVIHGDLVIKETCLFVLFWGYAKKVTSGNSIFQYFQMY